MSLAKTMISKQISYYSKLIQENNEWIYLGVFADEAVTGTKDNREQFNKKLEKMILQIQMVMVYQM